MTTIIILCEHLGAMRVSRFHPRYKSLKTRELLVKYLKDGVLAHAGLIAHGRGEAFDYLLGEKTSPQADLAENVAAAYFINAINPVISVNGNAAALAASEIVALARATGAQIEVNMFHWSEKRGHTIATVLKKAGARDVLFGRKKLIPGIASSRAKCAENGIYTADVVLVPLEDGDRAQALVKMGKIVIAIDLNPLSRTSKSATVTIVDELTRAIPRITKKCKTLKRCERESRRLICTFDNDINLKAVYKNLKIRLTELAA
jgi:4-phosphopantoate--beta-alanine ligase